MKIGKGNFSAVFKGLCISVIILLLAGISVRAYSDETPGGAAKAPAALGGDWVVDPTSVVAPNAYVSFSTVSDDGKRYYLGVDTTAAKSGTYRIAAYTQPSYATIWQVGPLWSYTGDILPEKNYQRTVWSVYIAEKCPANANKFLAVGTDRGSWSDLILVADEAEATLWYTEKDNSTTPGRYIQGYLYYESVVASTTVYRYLTYSDLYGFNRLYSTRPAVSQRISIWSRETGDKMSCYFMPGNIEFGYNRNPEGEDKSFAFRMRLDLDGDLFRSQFDGVEVYAKEPTVIDDQQALRDDYNVTFIMGWSSTHDTPAKRDTSIAHWPGEESTTIDTAMITLLPATPAILSTGNNRWEDDMKTIGASPKNVAGAPDHEDYIHIHMHYDGRDFDDSTRVIRRLYEDHPHTTLNAKPTPEGYAFGYSAGTQNTTFTLSAKYQDGYEVAALDGTVVSRSIGETELLDLTQIRGYRDTVWIPVVDATGDTTDWTYEKINLLDTLLISAYLSDGVTPAIGSGAGQWIQSVSLTARNRISVTAKGYDASATNIRAAMIKYSYTYRHSSMKGDTVRAEGVIWVTQDPNTPPAHGLINFSHQAGKSGLPQGPHDRQRVPELIYTTYIIPNEPLPLPIHRDHWGYYRWYNYAATNRDKDISQNWVVAETPKNYAENEFNPLDMYNSTYSHGRFDMRSHFTPGVATNSPAIQHKSGDAVLTRVDSVACDISIYTDTIAVGSLENSTLSALTEPTLGYRQIFDIRPAKEMADRMEQSRKRGDNDTLQYITAVAPYGRRYHITPESPYKITDGQIEAGHMQYVYYYRPNDKDTIDPNMGSKTGLSDAQLQDGANYHRIGLPAKTTGTISYSARLLSAEEVLNMPANTLKKVIMVNPRKSSGFVLGKRSGQADCAIMNNNRFDRIANAADLKTYIDTYVLNPNGRPEPLQNYVLNIWKDENGKFYLENDKENFYSYAYVTILPPFYAATAAWTTGRTGTDQWELSSFTDCSDANLMTDTKNSLLKLHVDYRHRWAILDWVRVNGYLTACSVNWWGTYSPDPYVVLNNGTEGSASNQGWIFYEVEVDDHLVRHAEHPQWWRRKIGEDWKKPQAADPSSDWASYEEHFDGTMSATYSTTSDPYVEYKLESEHFNLVKARVYLHDPEKEGPSTKAIITEDSIDNHYTVLATLGLEQIPAPGTNEIVTPTHHLEFEHTQFSYHYPVGDGARHIPASQRVSGTDRMPAKGEYITTNKFEKPGHYDFESCSGAEFGYMFCFNRASKPLVFLDFTMDQPACTDDELTLVANFANPSPNAPHVTARMYGKVNPSDPNWTLIYTYLTGEMEQSDRWYQVVLPLAKDTINKYKTFRCIGTVSGTDDHADAFLLFDRMRLIAKDRPLTSYQKRTTCQSTKDSIYIISRIDYRESELEPGSIICYQYQRWDNAANGGAGGYVPMQASALSGTWPTGTYTRLSAEETDVYPGYYKVGMSAEESVTNADFKSATLHADYGTIVVPEHDYNPKNSASSPDPYRVAAINVIAGIYGDDRSAYYDETDRTMSYSEITTAENFAEDFGPYATPKCKFYVNEGTELNPHWVMYLINRVYVKDSDNGKFRIAMNYVDAVDNRPDFSKSKCSTERIIEVKHAVSAMVDDKAVDGIHWHNYDREYLVANPSDEEFLPANTAHALSMSLTPPAGYKTGTEDRAECRFDLIRAFHFMEGYTEMTPEQQAAADAQWEEIYHCTPGEFQSAMEMFREPGDEDHPNPNSKIYRWNDVSKNDFQWHGDPKAKADSAYNLLDRLIKERLLEVGLSTREVYIGNEQDLYFYLRPIAASGTYIVAAHSGADSLVEASVCNNPIWVEMHSKQSLDSLRFGYDKKFGDAYAIPVIRASATVANSALPVRVAAFTHDIAANTGIVIGFDSTHIVETNDPAWIPGTSTFRYTQDRIVQERLYSGYYKEGDTILFRPVNAAHIDALKATGCECLNYDAHGTTYDPTNPREKDQAGTNVFIRPAAGVTNGCNQWHMLPSTSDPDPRKHMPGYHVVNNFTLHAGYWYKFKTSFFHTGEIIPYNTGDNPAGANSSFFILAVAPDTAIWAPSHDDGVNLWNDDDNWTPIVNGAPFHEALARVPMDGTDVIIGRPEIENHLPIVDNTLPGDIEKGEVDFGFQTATCRDILFRPLGQIYGQEYLTYRRAFTDVRFQEGTWRTFTPALKDIYSGDMYVPEDTAADMRSYFAPLTFASGGGFGPDHNRVWPYLFFQSFYNQTVKEAFNNTDEEGAPLTYREKSSAQWIQTNVLDKAFIPGAANAIIAWGPEGNTEDIIVRLPKQESAYHYMDLDGTVVSDPIPMGNRPAFADIRQNLAFDKDALNGNTYVDYTLTNETAAQMFFFGNATMELIDVYQLCLDNAAKLENEDGTSFVVYELTGESAYAVYVLNPTTVDRRNVFLAPMRAIGIKAVAPATELTIRLTTTALIPMPSMTATRGAADKTLAPMRRTEAYDEPYSATLYISATGSAQGENYKAYITLAESNTASDAFVGGEDAECLLSHNMDDFTFHTPLTMYTVCDNRTLMYDSREMVGRVPLGFSMLSDYNFDDRIILSFATEGQWDRPLYLHDALTGDSILIMNGMRLSVLAPANDELRYYINGGEPRFAEETTTGEEIATGIDNNGGLINGDASLNDGRTRIYDVLGRKVAILGENDLLTHLKLPTGVYVITRGDKTERVVIR